jgi:hypothetical protein
MRKLLVAYSMSSSYVQTTADYLHAIKSFSGYDVSYLHVTHSAYINIDLDAAGYDIVFQNYCARFCFEGYVSPSYSRALKHFRGLKVMAVQDEYDHTDRLKSAIKEHGFHIVLTCVPQDQIEKVYPRSEFPGIEFVSVLTGYVSDGFDEARPHALPLAKRPITIGYRGRDIGPKYGQLGFDKFEIGRRMKLICDARGIDNDIAMDDASRIYGPAWLEFIGNCRAMLGSESGSNVFDFDGSISAKLTAMTKRLGRVPKYEEFKSDIGDRESQIEMGQISPRVFECAVMRTPMILYRGRYSDAIVPDEHYIALERDFSNIDDVLQRMEDLPALKAMSDRAYDHLVTSGNFGYRGYCRTLREKFEARLATLKKADSVPAPELPTLGRNDLILREFPTPHPKGLNDLKLVHSRLASLAQLPQYRAIDVYYARSMNECMAALDTADTLRRRWAGACGSSEVDAVRVLKQDYAGIIRKRDTILRRRDEMQAALDKEGLELENEGPIADELVILDVQWASDFGELYSAFHNSYAKVFQTVHEEIAIRRKAKVAQYSPLTRQVMLRYYQIRDGLIITSALAQGSKLAFVKGVVRRVPFARTVALKMLRIAGRI